MVGGVCGWYTQIPLLWFTHRCSHYTNNLAATFYIPSGEPGSRESVSSAVRVLDFTYTLRVVFYNRGDLTGL